MYRTRPTLHGRPQSRPGTEPPASKVTGGLRRGTSLDRQPTPGAEAAETKAAGNHLEGDVCAKLLWFS